MESKEKNTKEKILEEALKLFAQSGYMGTSMNDIASKLGVTKAALYKHYKSKQDENGRYSINFSLKKQSKTASFYT